MRKRFFITITLTLTLAFFSPMLVSSSCSPAHTVEQHDTLYIERETIPDQITFSTYNIPEHVEFCGKDIDLTRFDRRERMDRELLAFMYMHSTSIQMIKRANRYFPVVEPILKEYGIPDDMKYMMVIESNVNPIARSVAGAAGLWQFMQTTGREHGLEVNANIDERYNVEKSTRAACKYLENAYAKYRDWATVAASYNAGQARISQQLATQKVTSSLDLFLVEETTRYVYRILAAKIMFQNPKNFGFYIKTTDLYPVIPCKEYTVTTGISDLSVWAKEKGINYSILRQLNPWIRENSLQNKTHRTYKILVPTKEGMYYDPKQIVPYDKNWVVE